MRSDGRLTHAKFLSYDVRYPVILPRRSWVTRLIIKDCHDKGNTPQEQIKLLQHCHPGTGYSQHGKQYASGKKSVQNVGGKNQDPVHK